MPARLFILGDWYSDRRGTYEVLGVTEGKIKIRYSDGYETLADPEVKARIHMNIMAERPIKEMDGGWLRIQPGSAGLRKDLHRHVCVYSLIWRQLDPPNPDDMWSGLILKFKDGDQQAIANVIRLLLTKLPPLLRELGLTHADRTINLVIALGAADTETNDAKPLTRLANALDSKMPLCHFRRNLLTKKKHPPLQSINDSRGRDATVARTYRVPPNSVDLIDIAMENEQENEHPVFLILDDFATRGSTQAEIYRALTDVWPDAKINAVALAKNVYFNVMRQIGYGEHDNKRRLGEII